MKYNNIIASVVIGASMIIAFNLERIENKIEYYTNEISEVFDGNQPPAVSPYEGVLDADRLMMKQDLMGKVWEEFLHKNKNSKHIKLIKDPKLGDYMCYPIDVIDEPQDDKYADMFIAYLNSKSTLDKNDWGYEDLSNPEMYATHPHGRNTLGKMSPAIFGCKKPTMLYRVNRYKKRLD